MAAGHGLLLVGEGGLGAVASALTRSDVGADLGVNAHRAGILGTGTGGVTGKAGRLEPAA